MVKHHFLFLLFVGLFCISCSKSEKHTSAKLKLNLSGITNLSNGIGSGGALLFGKSLSGEQFGRAVSASEQDIELPNGDWSFYAVMWDSSTATGNFKDNVYCGKSSQRLMGTAVNISMTLNNSICTDSDFSNGTHYVDVKNKFPNLFIEECDDLSQTNSFTCTRDNQGSALSYRMAFKTYNKAPTGAIAYTGEVMYSACKATQGTLGMFKQGSGINFPTSSQAMPFVISVEMFLGSPDCGVSTPEEKGMFTHTFINGVASETSATNKLAVSSATTCSAGPASEESCLNYMGVWSSNSCSLPDAAMSLFLPTAECGGVNSGSTTKSLKQMVAIPKDFLCRNTNLNLTGSDVFPGGDGSNYRPFKICTEWQLNQIGETYSTSSSLASKSFKLMSDLDMNNADFNVAARPSCVGAAGSIYKKHHNLNPIGQVTNGVCSSVATALPYTGIFNGNNKTISHGRINVDASEVGFVRNLGNGGIIKNLIFKNLEVEGISYVGGIAGKIMGSAGEVSNIMINGGRIEAKSFYGGGITASLGNANKILNAQAINMNIRADTRVGGLAATSAGSIEKSMFRGKIKQYTKTATFVGGLVGEGILGSSITTSFSEGAIESNAKWIGGVSGINDGNISNSYSNMYIISKYSDPAETAFIGGISGGNDQGVISKVYSDGILAYFGNGAGGHIADGIAAFAGTNPPTTNCFSSSANIIATSCIASTDLRSGTNSIFIGDTAWKANVINALPRLTWETNSRPCLLSENLATVTSQVDSGRGTYLLPVIICTPSQLSALTGSPANRYIKLGEDINIASWTSSSLISSFSGDFDGNGNSLFGLNLSNDTNSIGIFRNNNGVLSNIKLFGNSLSRTSIGATGILAGVNTGTIKNILMFGNSVQAESYAGQLVGENSISGIISDVLINNAFINANTFVGGMAGSNEGVIKRVSVNASVNEKAASTSYFKLGGIAGYNGVNGLIDQSVFSGKMEFNSVITNSTATYIGGLVGYNSGLISNSMTKNYSHIKVQNVNSVGGLVGGNFAGASLKNSISLGKIIYLNGEVPANSALKPLAGSGTGILTDNMYLENTIGGFLGQVISTFCNSTSIDFSGYTASYLLTPAPIADLIESTTNTYTGDLLNNFMTMSVPTTNYIVAYNNPATCTNGDVFSFYKKYDLVNTGKTISEFSSIGTFNTLSTFDIAYESSNAGLAKNVDRLIDYYKSQMYGTAPSPNPPIWELEENGSYPRLLQVRD